jgi:hypothetical protein
MLRGPNHCPLSPSFRSCLPPPCYSSPCLLPRAEDFTLILDLGWATADGSPSLLSLALPFSDSDAPGDDGGWPVAAAQSEQDDTGQLQWMVDALWEDGGPLGEGVASAGTSRHFFSALPQLEGQWPGAF